MNIKDITTESLEELVKNRKETDGRKNNTPPKKEYKSVLNFIKDRSIQQGDIRTPTSLIYYEYNVHYTRYHSSNKVGKIAFFHTFAQHFKQVRSNGKRYYMLNDSFDMSPERLEKAAKYVGKYRDNKKRKSKVSSVDSDPEPQG